MFLKKVFNKSRQVIMKLKSFNKKNDEEIGEEIVFIVNVINYNNSLSMILILSFL